MRTGSRRLLVAALTLAATAAGAPVAAAAPQPGLKGEYFDYTDLSGKVAERIDLTVDFNWLQTEPVPGVGADFSVRWTGAITPPATRTYTFVTKADDGVRLWVDGTLVIDDWHLHSATERSGTIALEGGRAYPIRLEYFDGTKNASVKLSWRWTGEDKAVVPSSALSTEVAGDPDPDPDTGGGDPDPDTGGGDPDPDPDTGGGDPDPDPDTGGGAPDPDPGTGIGDIGGIGGIGIGSLDLPSIQIPRPGAVAAPVVPAGNTYLPKIGDLPRTGSIVSYGGPLDPPAPPVAGETFNAAPSGDGEVLVRRPADGQLIPLDRAASLPVGTHVDTREAGVQLQTAPAAGVERATQDMHFEGGMFEVGQPRGGDEVVEIDLLHGEFKEVCGPLSKAERRAIRRRGAVARAAGRKSDRVLRRLWGKGKGRFRTKGRHAAATVRGTSWSIADRCDETSVRVHEGVVDVENLLTGAVVTLTAGERYAARP